MRRFFIVFILFRIFSPMKSFFTDILFCKIIFEDYFANPADLLLSFVSILLRLLFLLYFTLILFLLSFRMISIFLFCLKMCTLSMPASLASRANVIPSKIVMSDDKFDASYAPLSNELSGSAVKVNLVEISHYRCKEEWLSVKQIADPAFPLRDIRSSQVQILVAQMCALELDYRSKMITVTCLRNVTRRIH